MMDKSFVQAITENARRPHVQEINGLERMLIPQPDGDWRVLDGVPDKEPVPEIVGLDTLNGLVDYVTQNRDQLYHNQLTVVIESPTEARLIGKLTGPYAQRITYARALEGVTRFQEATWLGHEDFMIAVMANIVDSPEKTLLLSKVGNIRSEAVNQSNDDGVSQSVVARRGAVLVENVEMPRVIELAPYRAFNEVVQVPSPYVLRLRQGAEGQRPTLALFLADGGRWRIEAMNRVAEWLSTRLPPAVAVIH